MSEAKKYEIDGQTYVQKPLVLGQVRQLLDALEGITIDPAVGTLGIVRALGNRLPQVVAIVLTQDGQSPAGKDLEAAAEGVGFNISPEQVLEVLEDFFVCNPLSLLLDRLAGFIEEVTPKIIGSINSSASSPEETSLSNAKSSGDAQSESASPT